MTIEKFLSHILKKYLYSCVFDDTREEGLYIMEVLDNRNRERRERRKLTIQMYSVLL
jgi:hypothetical protein